MKLKNNKYLVFLSGLAVWEFLILEFSFFLAYFIRHYPGQIARALSWQLLLVPQNFAKLHAYQGYWRLSWIFSGLLILLFYFFGLYRMRRGEDQLDEYFVIFKAASLGVLILIGFTFFIHELSFSRFVILASGLLAFVLVCLWRTLLWLLVGWAHRLGHGINHTLIYGAGQAGLMLVEQIRERGELGYKLEGFIDDDPDKIGQEYGGLKVLGAAPDLPRLVRENRVEEIIIAFPSASRRKIYEVIELLKNTAVSLKIMPDLYDIATSRVSTDKIGNIPLLDIEDDPLAGWPAVVKRLVDITGAAFGLIILAPLFLLIALAIKLTSPGPVFYKQTRLGRDQVPFTVYKFRSMRIGAEKEKDRLLACNEAAGPIFKMKDDPRLTPVGKFLRRASLDELPQLFNVLLGNMSLVGPRPPLPREVAQYNDWQKRRLAITPGITGLWQIRGRSLLPFAEMVKLDIYYQENWSLWLDFKILLKTIGVVLTGRGAY